MNASIRSLRPLLALAALAALAVQALAQGDGPRAYFLVPDGVRQLTLNGLFISGNRSADPGIILRGSSIDASIGALQYTHTLRAGDQQAALILLVPFGEVEGSVRLPNRVVRGSSSGLGDLQLRAVVGLKGSPALSKADWAAYKPGLAIGVLGGVTAPTGKYDSSKVLNMGANRWAFQVGGLFGYYLGKSFLDPELATFELSPSITFYTNNDDPFGAGSKRQDPIFKLEGHITRNLNQAVWLSLDMLFVSGGETTTDGVSGGNSQRALMLGGTVGVNLSQTLMAKLSYGTVASRNDSGADGTMFRVVISKAF